MKMIKKDKKKSVSGKLQLTIKCTRGNHDVFHRKLDKVSNVFDKFLK